MIIKIEDAITYFEDAVKESDEIIEDCSPKLQAELRVQKGYFIAALDALRKKQEREKLKGKKETNQEHFFGNVLIADTIMLLTYNDHPRAECRLFKKVLIEMSPSELITWLYSDKDQRFNW